MAASIPPQATNTHPEIRTDRLLLRHWRPTDLERFASLNADPRVMEHFPSTLTREESDAFVRRIEEHFELHGFGWWAVEVAAEGVLAGFVGLARPAFTAPFTPCVEVGWRLAADCWGKGIASEGARAVLAFGFETLGLDEIVSFTAVGNQRSQAVMERIGMRRDHQGDFDHPNLPPGHRLRRHVLYRIKPAHRSDRPTE